MFISTDPEPLMIDPRTSSEVQRDDRSHLCANRVRSDLSETVGQSHVP